MRLVVAANRSEHCSCARASDLPSDDAVDEEDKPGPRRNVGYPAGRLEQWRHLAAVLNRRAEVFPLPRSLSQRGAKGHPFESFGAPRAPAEVQSSSELKPVGR